MNSIAPDRQVTSEQVYRDLKERVRRYIQRRISHTQDPMNPGERNNGIAFGKAIHIGNNVWLGGSCTVFPGVTIGNNAVVGADSVVTKIYLIMPSWPVIRLSLLDMWKKSNCLYSITISKRNFSSSTF